MMQADAPTQKRPINKKWSEPQVHAFFEEYKTTTGISIKDFCKRKNISPATYYNWQKRFAMPQARQPSQPSGFLPLSVLPATLPPASPVLFAEVNGIRLYQPVTAQYLKLLLR